MTKAGNNKSWLRAQSAATRPATRSLVAVGLLNTAAAILQAFCLARLIGPVLVGAKPSDIAAWASLFAVAALSRAAISLFTELRSFEVGSTARRRLRTEFLVAALARGPHRGSAVGEAVATAVDQVEKLDSFFGRWLSAATLAWAGPLLVLLAILPMDKVAAMSLAVGGLLVPVGLALAGIGAAVASQQQFTAMTRLQSRFLDRVRGIATIVLAGQAEAEANRLREAANELRVRTMKVLRVAFLSSAILDAAAVTVLVFLAVRAGGAWQDGELHPITAVFGLMLVSEFFAPLRSFAASYQDRIQADTASNTLGAIPVAQPVGPATPSIRNVSASGVTVAFENVSYTWSDGRAAALQNLSFRVPANETAVLVGPSGSGKSTVLELLLGFIRPANGRVTINGADLLTLTPAALSRLTAWIGQRPVLFAGSIRDNIRFGHQDASNLAVEEAARAGGLQAVAAAMPNGLDTIIGEGGYGLSGGQAQRVAIARAFVRNAPLLLLDEPTAHLDPATEADILESLRRLALGRTVILAAHSSAAMSFGGRHIVLDHGRIAMAQGAA